MNNNIVYGYCRVSTQKQSLQRQIDNITSKYPEAVIITEKYTGTKIDRPEWSKLYKKIKQNVKDNQNCTVVFDEVSRMSRNAEDGFSLYMELFSMGVSLIFLKEPHINTDSYKKAMEGIVSVNITSGHNAADNKNSEEENSNNTLINDIIDAINKFMQAKVKEDIKLSFERAEEEVVLLHKRISDGMKTIQRANERYRITGETDKIKQIGGVSGKKLTTKKSIEKKAEILKHSVDFGGTLNDVDCMKLTGLSRNTFYKYKRELKAEAESEEE